MLSAVRKPAATMTQPNSVKSMLNEYRSSLNDLDFNSKPMINVLTMLAEENESCADGIVKIIKDRILKNNIKLKLPSLYLLDSILKNVGGDFISIIANHMTEIFANVFEHGDDKVRISLFKLRNTWPQYFPGRFLHELDTAIKQLDSNWPVAELPSSAGSIHINPKFLLKTEHETDSKEEKPKDVDSFTVKENNEKLVAEEQRIQEKLKQLQEEQKKIQLSRQEEERIARESAMKHQQLEREKVIEEQQKQIETLRRLQNKGDTLISVSTRSKMQSSVMSQALPHREMKQNIIKRLVDPRTRIQQGKKGSVSVASENGKETNSSIETSISNKEALLSLKEVKRLKIPSPESQLKEGDMEKCYANKPKETDHSNKIASVVPELNPAMSMQLAPESCPISSFMNKPTESKEKNIRRENEAKKRSLNERIDILQSENGNLQSSMVEISNAETRQGTLQPRIKKRRSEERCFSAVKGPHETIANAQDAALVLPQKTGTSPRKKDQEPVTGTVQKNVIKKSSLPGDGQLMASFGDEKRKMMADKAKIQRKQNVPSEQELPRQMRMENHEKLVDELWKRLAIGEITKDAHDALLKQIDIMYQVQRRRDSIGEKPQNFDRPQNQAQPNEHSSAVSDMARSDVLHLGGAAQISEKHNKQRNDQEELFAQVENAHRHENGSEFDSSKIIKGLKVVRQASNKLFKENYVTRIKTSQVSGEAEIHRNAGDYDMEGSRNENINDGKITLPTNPMSNERNDEANKGSNNAGKCSNEAGKCSNEAGKCSNEQSSQFVNGLDFPSNVNQIKRKGAANTLKSDADCSGASDTSQSVTSSHQTVKEIDPEEGGKKILSSHTHTDSFNLSETLCKHDVSCEKGRKVEEKELRVKFDKPDVSNRKKALVKKNFEFKIPRKDRRTKNEPPFSLQEVNMKREGKNGGTFAFKNAPTKRGNSSLKTPPRNVKSMVLPGKATSKPTARVPRAESNQLPETLFDPRFPSQAAGSQPFLAEPEEGEENMELKSRMPPWHQHGENALNDMRQVHKPPSLEKREPRNHYGRRQFVDVDYRTEYKLLDKVGRIEHHYENAKRPRLIPTPGSFQHSRPRFQRPLNDQMARSRHEAPLRPRFTSHVREREMHEVEFKEPRGIRQRFYRLTDRGMVEGPFRNQPFGERRHFSRSEDLSHARNFHETEHISYENAHQFHSRGNETEHFDSGYLPPDQTYHENIERTNEEGTDFRIRQRWHERIPTDTSHEIRKEIHFPPRIASTGQDRDVFTSTDMRRMIHDDTSNDKQGPVSNEDIPLLHREHILNYSDRNAYIDNEDPFRERRMQGHELSYQLNELHPIGENKAQYTNVFQSESSDNRPEHTHDVFSYRNTANASRLNPADLNRYEDTYEKVAVELQGPMRNQGKFNAWNDKEKMGNKPTDSVMQIIKNARRSSDVTTKFSSSTEEIKLAEQGPKDKEAFIGVRELFQKLVSSGIIEPKNVVADSQSSSTPPPKLETRKISIPKMSFVMEDLKVRHSAVVNILYSGTQCASCGLRFSGENKQYYGDHLDWHFRNNRRGKEGKKSTSRQWYYYLEQWLDMDDVTDLNEQAKSNIFEIQLRTEVPVDTIVDTSCAVLGEDEFCNICFEALEQFWDESLEEWRYKSATRVNGKTYHISCFGDIESGGLANSSDQEILVDEGSSLLETKPLTQEIDGLSSEIQFNESRIKEELSYQEVGPSKDVFSLPPLEGHIPGIPSESTSSSARQLGVITGIKREFSNYVARDEEFPESTPTGNIM